MTARRWLMVFSIFILVAGCYKENHLKGDGETDVTGDGADDEGVAQDLREDDTAEVPPPGCPAAEPEPGSDCDDEGARCEYGSETCCGVTYPSFVCECGGGHFMCYYTDACMGAPFGCACEVDEDCENGFGRAWCEGGTCVPCDNSGLSCTLYCPNGFVPPRNGCQPCECAPRPCERVGEGYCTCDALCGGVSQLCEAGLGRCIEDICAIMDCVSLCDPLRGCVERECGAPEDCKLIYSTCGCQAVAATDPRTELDPCLYDGGETCAANVCEVDGVLADCRGGLCVEVYPPGCGG